MTDKEQLLAEIIQYSDVPRMQTGDITLYDYVDRVGCSRAVAATRLKALVNAGVLETEIALCPDSRQRRVYRRPSNS